MLGEEYPRLCPECGAKNEERCPICVKCRMVFTVELPRETEILQRPSSSFGCGMGLTPTMDAPHLEREDL